MNDSIKTILSDKGSRYALLAAIFILLFEVGLVILRFTALPPLLPLFNSLSWGDQRLAVREIIFLIPFLLLVIGMVNIILASKAYRKHALLSRMLSYNVLLCSLLSVIALIQILFLVF